MILEHKREIMTTTDYVKSDTAKLSCVNSKGKKYSVELLWGDEVRILSSNGTTAKIKARGLEGTIKKSDLGGEPLLETYFIDVGQGDGMLIVTPDRRHLLMDGGWPRRFQPTNKNAADFVDWKFHKDYGMDQIELDAVLCSHNDQDHYGGLWDLFNPAETHELDIKTKNVVVENFYHAGLSWWKLNGKKSLGRTAETTEGKFFTDLIDSRATVMNALKTTRNPHLRGEWSQFLKCATKIKTKSGTAMPMKRLSHCDEFVPGFDPTSSDIGIKVLAPVEFDIEGDEAIRYFSGGPSKNTNGNSLLLRVDYGRFRMLLTGDLNTKSMRALLDDWTGQRQEFECDIAKACHHGSDDVSYEFLSALRPAVTVISSGDNESHDHPRPGIVAASATTGYLMIDNDKIISPLIYSTELARSVKLGKPVKARVPKSTGTGTHKIEKADLNKISLTLEETNAGQRNPKTKYRRLGSSHVVSGTIYGLVNIRTDGDRILCATMNEAKHEWEIKVLQSRF